MPYHASVSTEEIISLLNKARPLARQLAADPLNYTPTPQEEALLRSLIERIDQADFSTPALRALHQQTGLSLEEMRSLRHWYSRWYFQNGQPGAVFHSPDGPEIEEWLSDS
jgi:hypothetical protein